MLEDDCGSCRYHVCRMWPINVFRDDGQTPEGRYTAFFHPSIAYTNTPPAPVLLCRSCAVVGVNIILSSITDQFAILISGLLAAQSSSSMLIHVLIVCMINVLQTNHYINSIRLNLLFICKCFFEQIYKNCNLSLLS